MGHNGTGTIRENRIPRNTVMETNKYMSKAERGKSIAAHCVTKWTDNRCVVVASTVHGMQPISICTRFSRVERTRIEDDRPNAVAMYNKNMGGTDRMEQNIGYNRIGMRKEKW